MMRYIPSVAIVCLLIAASCEKAGNQPATTDSVGFNEQAKLLMTLPAGYEAGDVTFSAAGHQVAVVLNKNGKTFMSVNSVLSSSYDSVRDPAFHDDSKQYAFVAVKGGQECVVLNGKEGPFYDGIERPMITSDARLVYAAKRGGKWHIVAGDKVSQAFDSPGPSLHVSPDGKRLAYVERNGAAKKLNVRTCGIELEQCASGRAYDEITGVIMSLSGSHLAYRVNKNRMQAIVLLDLRQPGCIEKESRWYENIGGYVLSNNGEHAAFFAHNGNDKYLVSGKNEWSCANYSMLFDIALSDSGNALYTGVIKDSIIISLDGKVVDDRRESIDYLSFSGDSGHYVFVAGPCPFELSPPASASDKSHLVIGRHESRKYDKIVRPRFTTDNTLVVFRAREAGRRFLVVADRMGKIIEEHQPYDAVWEFTFSPGGGSVGYGVRSGRELWWKVKPLK